MELRLAELVAGLSVASDLGKGLTDGQGLRACVRAMRVADVVGLSPEDRETLFWVALLRFVGCTATATEMAAGLGDEIAVSAAFADADVRDLRDALRRVVGLVGARPDHVGGFLAKVGRVIGEHETASCEVAQLIADDLGLPAAVGVALSGVFERYDGHGTPGHARGEGIPLPARVWQVAHCVDLLLDHSEPGEVVRVLRRRGGTALDPDIAGCAAAAISDLSEPVGATISAVLDAEPGSPRLVREDDIDRVLTVFGLVADLKSPYFRGHSERVAALAGAAATLAGCDDVLLRRAGFVHDIGRVAVSSRIWNATSPLSEAELEQVRSHVYFTARILQKVPAPREVADVACSHHERCDGSGYHRGLAALSPAAALLATADAFVTMGEDRPHRGALPAPAQVDALRDLATAGLLPVEAVDAVVAAAGHSTAPTGRVGLTDRERDVMELVAQGLTNRAAAHRLGISPKTVNTHLEHVYAKLGVSTRASAIVAASRCGWLAM